MRVQADELERPSGELAELILSTVPHYAQATRGDLQASCRANLARSLQSLSGDLAASEDLLDAPAHTARIRARQGVPLDSLLASYRLGGRVLWQRLLREARAQHDGLDAEPLLDVATAVWLVVEEHSAAVSRAYRAEQELLHSQDLRREQVLLDALLDDDADPAAAQQAAVSLGLPSRASWSSLSRPTSRPTPSRCATRRRHWRPGESAPGGGCEPTRRSESWPCQRTGSPRQCRRCAHVPPAGPACHRS